MRFKKRNYLDDSYVILDEIRIMRRAMGVSSHGLLHPLTPTLFQQKSEDGVSSDFCYRKNELC